VPSPIPELYQGRLYRTGDRACLARGRRHRIPRPPGSSGENPRLPHRARRCGAGAACGIRGLAKRGRVCASRIPAGAKYLAAYAEARAGIVPTDLREHMQRQVPHYMVPDIVAVLPRLPLKPERQGRSLGAGARSTTSVRANPSQRPAPPRPVEEALAGPLGPGAESRPTLRATTVFFTHRRQFAERNGADVAHSAASSRSTSSCWTSIPIRPIPELADRLAHDERGAT